MVVLDINNLHVSTNDTAILKGIQLQIQSGETVALMGPNGSSKSTLAHVLMGHPSYQVTAGHIYYHGQDLLAMKPEERAQAGLFLSFQYPQEIAGVTLGNFLRLAYNATHSPLSVSDFILYLKTKLDLLALPHDFIMRSVNEGFSGGEKKRLEMLQLAVLSPQLAILDETDSGLDIDALKIVAHTITTLKQANPSLTLLVITHYPRLLDHLTPDRLVIMHSGHIIATGQSQLLTQIERQGYDSLTSA